MVECADRLRNDSRALAYLANGKSTGVNAAFSQTLHLDHTSGVYSQNTAATASHGAFGGPTTERALRLTSRPALSKLHVPVATPHTAC